jgi:hypothetical protein
MLGLGLGMGMSRYTQGSSVPPLPTAGLRGLYYGDMGYGGGAWNDQSGIGNHLTLTGTSVGTSLNGLATVDFNGTGDSALRDVFSLGAAGTVSIFGVVQVLGGSGDDGICHYSDNVFDGHGFGVDDGVALLQNAITSQVGTVNLASGWHCVGTVQRAQVNTDRLYVNGVQDATQASASSVADNLGFYIGLGNGAFSNVRVAAVAVYNVAVDVAAVTAALMGRYAL